MFNLSDRKIMKFSLWFMYVLYCKITEWKFKEFSATQILREINFEDSISAISAILTNLEALNFEFHDFLHFWKAEIYQINQS